MFLAATCPLVQRTSDINVVETRVLPTPNELICALPKTAAQAEFVTRANRGMRIGNFELDFEDGEIRYKTSIDIEGGELTNTMIHNLLQANLSTMDRYFPGIMELIYSEKSPKELIQKIEGIDGSVHETDDEDEEPDFGGGEFRSESDTDDDEEEGNQRRLG